MDEGSKSGPSRRPSWRCWWTHCCRVMSCSRLQRQSACTSSLASRLEQLRGALALAELAGAISDAGEPLGVLDDAGRSAAVAKIQRRYAALFEDLLRVAFLTYYEQPKVQDAIRALGFTYHAHPLPAGYAAQIGRFNPAADAPTHGRGRYKKTEDVRRLPLDGLGLLGARDGG